MNKSFTEMLCREPDKVINGDLFFRVPWYERGLTKEDLYAEKAEKESRATFMKTWEHRTFEGEYEERGDSFWENWMDWWTQCLKGKNKDTEIEAVFRRIAEEEIPFMDIASSESMGIASYIMKLNPHIPCLVTDIDTDIIKRLRLRIDEYLPEYNISLASFDNLDIPLKDNSIECVTSMCGILSAATMRGFTGISFAEFSDSCHIKLLDEVYRILKPGGYFITV